MITKSDRSAGPRLVPVLILILLAMVTLIGCTAEDSQPTSTSEPLPTETPIPPPTATPEPTHTPEPTPTPTQTHTPTPDLEATAAAQATKVVAALIDDIGERLAEIKLSPDRGFLGWAAAEPITIPVSSYGTLLYEPLDPERRFSDFVLHANVTWDSTSGLAGCGMIVRSEDDLSEGEQYRFYTLRLSGLPAWDVELWQYDTWQSTTTGDIKTSRSIDLEAGSTNEYFLVADGNLLTVYANDSRLGAVTILKRRDGQIAFFTFQESGETTCIFDDIWVWVLEE